MGIAGEAMKILRTVKTPFQTLKELFDMLRKTYGEYENRMEALESLRQEQEESVRRFLGRLSAGLTLTGLREYNTTWDATLLHHFKDKLQPDIKKLLMTLYPVTLKAAVDQSIAIETELKSKRTNEKFYYMDEKELHRDRYSNKNNSFSTSRYPQIDQRRASVIERNLDQRNKTSKQIAIHL